MKCDNKNCQKTGCKEVNKKWLCIDCAIEAQVKTAVIKKEVVEKEVPAESCSNETSEIIEDHEEKPGIFDRFKKSDKAKEEI